MQMFPRFEMMPLSPGRERAGPQRHGDQHMAGALEQPTQQIEVRKVLQRIVKGHHIPGRAVICQSDLPDAEIHSVDIRSVGVETRCRRGADKVSLAVADVQQTPAPNKSLEEADPQQRHLARWIAIVFRHICRVVMNSNVPGILKNMRTLSALT